MDGCEPRFLPQWLKGTASEERIGVLTHLDTSASSKINRAQGSWSTTERISTNKAWRRSAGNIRKNHHHCERDGFSKLQDCGSFRRSYSEESHDLCGKEKEPTNQIRWDAVLNTRTPCTNMNCSSHVNSNLDSFGASRRSSASPLGNRDKSNSLLRRSRSFALDDGSVDSSGKLQTLVSTQNHTNHSILPNKMHRASFDRDFPLLPADVRNGAVDSSPRGTSLSASSKLICNGYGSSGVSPDWKSALAEPPPFVSVAPSETQLNYCLSAQNVSTNVLEISMQKSKYEDNNQSQVEPNKMVEMALKQPRQLIPAPPSMPKGMHGIGYCKGKSSAHVNMSTTGNFVNSTKPKSPSLTHGGARSPVLKTAKDHLVSANKSPTTDQTTTVKNVNSGNTSATHKHVDAAASLYTGQKKPTRQSIKERNEFFNSLRQKGASECSSPKSRLSLRETQSMAKLDECDESEFCGSKGDNVLDVPMVLEAVNNEDSKLGVSNNVDKSAPTVPSHFENAIPAEEEAFLRRLGWDEGAGGDEALTEEEINSFILQHMQAVLSKNMLRGKNAWKLSALRMHEMRVGDVGRVSSD